MQGNDIAFTAHQHIACHFEGLLMTPQPEPEPEVSEERRRWWQRKKEDPKFEPILEDDNFVRREMRRWKANEMPLKSVIHMTQQLGLGVEVYTYMDVAWNEAIEHWLARKGAVVQVHHYDDVQHLVEELRFNRDIHTYFTPYESDAAIIGWHRATVVNPLGTFGI